MSHEHGHAGIFNVATLVFLLLTAHIASQSDSSSYLFDGAVRLSHLISHHRTPGTWPSLHYQRTP
jgi:hypothetical protein